MNNLHTLYTAQCARNDVFYYLSENYKTELNSIFSCIKASANAGQNEVCTSSIQNPSDEIKNSICSYLHTIGYSAFITSNGQYHIKWNYKQ